MSIGQLARAAGVGVETVRYYERESLLQKPPRGLRGTGIRRYPAEALQRLRFIRRAKELGFTLEDIRTLITACGTPDANCGEVHAVAKARLADIEERVQQLSRARDLLQAAVQSCRDGEVASCGIIRALSRDTDPPRSEN
jgi:MerR family mercuric resistance operon transcriptional regulator